MKQPLIEAVAHINAANENVAKICAWLVARGASGDDVLLDYFLTKMRELMVIAKKLEAKKRYL